MTLKYRHASSLVPLHLLLSQVLFKGGSRRVYSFAHSANISSGFFYLAEPILEVKIEPDLLGGLPDPVPEPWGGPPPPEHPQQVEEEGPVRRLQRQAGGARAAAAVRRRLLRQLHLEAGAVPRRREVRPAGAPHPGGGCQSTSLWENLNQQKKRVSDLV